MRDRVPLSQRKQDVVLLAFFCLNLGFITYVVDLEQLVIPDASSFTYPIWPPPPLVDLVHWWGRTFDPVLIARPVWWKVTIWIDALFFGPFYAVAIYAYAKGHEWIRIPSVVYAAMLLTNVLVILGEELFGPNKTPAPAMVLAANLPWLLMPLFIIFRMGTAEHPFTRPKSEARAPGASAR